MEIVSVLVPLFNNEQYIETALNSLLTEVPERLELLVLDDGSADNSFSVASQWLDRHENRFYAVRIWSRANKGIPGTLNELVNASSGEYITILPADDELLPGGIDTRIAALKSDARMLCVFGDAKVIDSSGRVISDSALFEYPERHVRPHSWALTDQRLLALEMILRWAVPGPVFLARSSVYSTDAGVGTYDESLSAEDRDFYLRNLANKTIAYVDRKVSCYRVHGRNVSTFDKTSLAIRESVCRSERKNVGLFAGAENLALHVVYFYKKSVGDYLETDKPVLKLVYFLSAVTSRIVIRAFDIVQILRRIVAS